MKEVITARILRIIPLLVAVCVIGVPAQAKYGGGTGEPNDPHLIYTAEQMNEIGADSNDWDKHFKLMADIDLAAYTGTDFNIIGYGVGWWASPDNKKPFTGVFDGNGRSISNFSYSSTTEESYVGIFGYVERAKLENLRLINPSINVEGGTYVGSLVGVSHYATITACYAQGGNVSSRSEVGGLVGINRGMVTECSSSATVSGYAGIGGLVGYNHYGSIGNCYSLGSVSGTTSVGGLAGYCSSQATIAHCYSAGKVQGTENVGGLLGLTHQGEILNCFWDVETSGQISSAGGIGKTTAEMQTASTFAGWGCYAAWTISEGLDYPRLRWENMPGDMLTTASFPSIEGNGTEDDPYLIYTAEQFTTIGLFPCEWDRHFKLMADIDLSSYTWATSNTIGRYVHYPSPGYKPFSGVFDGNGHRISRFSCSSDTAQQYMGIFGYAEGAEIKNLGLVEPNIEAEEQLGYVGPLVAWLENATVSNCSVEGGSVSGGSTVGGLIGRSYFGTITNCSVNCIISGVDEVGGLAGSHFGTITHCASSGEVSATGQRIGGLVGRNSGSINESTSEASVSGVNQVGGLVGTQWGGRIIDCCSTGSVIGIDQVGGLVGGNNGTIANCYTTADVSGVTYVGGFAGQNGLNLSDVVFGGLICDCYATGSVSGETCVAGLVGYNDRWGAISNSYAASNISGVSEVGGLVGQNRKGEVADSFWDVETSGQSTSAAGTGKTTVEMQDPNMFMNVGWDFVDQPDGPDDIWGEPAGSGYPVLWWQLSALPLLPTFSGGTGEPNAPYLIATAEDLNRLGHNPRLMRAHFRLTNDIDLEGVDLSIIGNRVFPFRGVFDGSDKKILNFRCSYAGVDDIGLFRCVGQAEIKDLQLIDPNVDCPAGDRIGALVGWASGTIKRCEVVGGSVRGSWSVAMLVGENSGQIVECFTTGSVVGSQNVGGLVGRNYETVAGCGAWTHVSGSWSVGGLVGRNAYNSLVENSFADGTVIGKLDNVGGLVGTNGENATVVNCYAAGTVTGRNDVGGLVGRNIRPYTWPVKPTLIYNCYAWTQTEGESEVGGLVGTNAGCVSMCYAMGKVVGESEVGGLVGHNHEGEGTVTSSFWDTETSGQATSDGGMDKSTAEMQMGSTFTDAGWDFVAESVNGTDDIWAICEGVDYPHLAWEFVIGDFDADADTDLADFCILAEHWLATDGSFWCGQGCDLTNDGSVNWQDLMVFAENWLRHTPQ